MGNCISLIFLLFFLVGCSSLPPLSFNVPNVDMAKRRIDAEVKSVSIRLAPEERRTGDIKVMLFENPNVMRGTGSTTGTAITEQWRLAIQDALDRKLLFTDNSKNTLGISVEVLKLTGPAVSFKRFTETEARYDIVDRSTGKNGLVKDSLLKRFHRAPPSRLKKRASTGKALSIPHAAIFRTFVVEITAEVAGLALPLDQVRSD